MNPSIERLWGNAGSFLSDTETPDDIAISTRIRLARNLAGFPFPSTGTPEQSLAVRECVREAASDARILPEMLQFDVPDLSAQEREFLFERRLASRELLNSHPAGASVLCSGDESAAILVNEEDHLRLQVLKPGFCLEEAWQQLDAIDTELSGHLDYAFDQTLGYLTCCPTNVGTGMRASVMLHLPGLVFSKQITAVIQGVNKLGFAVRGIFGEGTANRGNLFQISNQSTLGESEAQIIDHLSAIIRQLISHEENTRKMILVRDRYGVMNQVGRAYGLLKHAYKLTLEEALDALSGIRLGADLGMFNSVSVGLVNELFAKCGTAHLEQMAGKSLTPAEVEIQRATFFREKLSGSR